MAAPVLYADLTALKDRLCVSDDDRDFALERCLDSASRWIEAATARKFYTATQTRYYTARYRAWMPPSDISERPGGGTQFYNVWGGTPNQYVIIDDVIDVTEVATDEDGDGVYERIWTVGTDYWLGPRNAAADGKPYSTVNRNPVLGRYFFPWLDGAISVTGSFGYTDTVPADIRELCMEVTTVFAQPVLDLGIAGVQQYQIGPDLKVTLKAEELSPLAQTIVRTYQGGPV